MGSWCEVLGLAEKQLLPDLLRKGEKLYAYYNDAYSKDMGTMGRLERVRRDYMSGRITV